MTYLGKEADNFNPSAARRVINEKDIILSHTPTQVVETLAPWIGGKRLLSKTIAEYIRKTKHSCYAEPFVGMGGVFFSNRR